MDRETAGSEYKTPERLGACLDSYLTGTGKLQQHMGALFELKRLWCSLMGERISQISSPYRIKDGVLHVAVHDSMWIAELPYIKADMLKKLAEAGLELADLKFTLSKVPQAKQAAKFQAPAVSKEQQLWAERLAANISDEKTREAYLKALLACMWRMPK